MAERAEFCLYATAPGVSDQIELSARDIVVKVCHQCRYEEQICAAWWIQTCTFL